MRFHTVLFTCLLSLCLPHKLLAQELVFSTFQGAPIQGLSALVLDEAYRYLNIPIKVRSYPGRRALIEADLGVVDGEVSRVSGLEEKYENLIRIPIPINYLEGAVFTKNIDIEIIDWRSLEPYVIGVPLGAQFAESPTKHMQRILVPSYNQLFAMLDADRIELVVSPLINGLSIIRQNRLKGLKPLDHPLVKTQLYHYLHKKHVDLVPKIEKAIEIMQDNGRIATLREKFVRRMSKI